MKQANIVLKLSKDHDLHKSNVTPIEVLLLVAEHHTNVGGSPVEVDEKSITDVKDPTGEVDKDGKPITRDRTVDDELSRLRGRYPGKKVDALNQVRDLNIDFKKAIEMGTKLKLPTGALAEAKII